MRRMLLALVVILLLAVAGYAGAGQPQASCAGPSIRVGSERVAPGETFRVRGTTFSRGCDNIGSEFSRSRPDRDIRIVFRQDQRTWKLTTVDAAKDYTFSEKLRVPDNADSGRAVVIARGSLDTLESTIRVTSDDGGGESEELSDDPKPPESTLAHGGRSVTGALGTYCWSYRTSATMGVGQCVDTMGVPVPGKDRTLTVPASSILEFHYERERLDSVEASAYPLIRGKQAASKSKSLRLRRRGDRVLIPVTLPPGKYVFDVFLYGPEGDVSYGFRIRVEPESQPAL